MMTLKFSWNTKETRAYVQCVLQLMMTLKIILNAKVTRALTDRRLVRLAADDDFEI